MNEEDEADVVVDYEGNSSDEEGPIPLSPGDNNDANNNNDEPKKANNDDDETHHPQGESITQNNVTQKNEENQFHNNGVKSNHDLKNIENDNDGDDNDDDDEEEGMVKEESKTDEEVKTKTSTTSTASNNNSNVNLVTSPKSPLDGELKSSRTPSTQRSDHYNNNTNMSMRVSKSHPQQNQSRGYYDEHRNRAKESPSFKRPRYSHREDYDRRRTANREEIGIYIPPAKRKLLQQQREESKKEGGEEVESNHTQQRQRILWQELKKSIHAVLNRLNSKTIKPLIHQLFTNCNLIRGRGILAKSLLRAASTSPTYIHVYAALVAVLNTKLPEIGELILHRTIHAFQRSYARRDKSHALAMVLMIGHLFNQGVCFELLILQILTVLLERPTDDSIEVALVLIRTTGQSLLESTPAGLHAVMEQLRHLLHDGGDINKRIQYQVQEFLQLRKQNLEGLPPPIIPELDLVERDEQITLEWGLDDDDENDEEDKLQTHLDVFHYDANWDENENEWKNIQKEILGGDSDEDDDDGSGESSTDDGDDGSSSEEDSSSDEEDTELPPDTKKANTDDQKQLQVIQDLSEADLIHLRRTIYLTIMSSATFEECTHKLTKVDIPPGSEMELVNMIIECCSQERTFLRYYGLISGRFCLLHERWRLAFEQSFEQQYNTIHRLETNKLRNVAKMFAHILHTDSMSWSCLHIIHLNEDETTSSSRIFIKIVIQELAENMGMGTLCRRFLLNEEESDTIAVENKTNNKHIEDQRMWFQGMFPKDVPRNTRYAINFFTSIGLGPLTDSLREHLKNAPKMILAQAAAKSTALTVRSNSSSDSDSRSSSSGSSSSYSSSSSSSYTSSSSGSSSSYTSGSYSSSSSSDSHSRRRRSRRRSSSDKRNYRNRRRYSSSESDSDSRSMDRSTTKKSDKKAKPSSRRRGSRRDRHSRSCSPPRHVIMKTDVDKSGHTDTSVDDKRKESKPKDSRERSSSKGKSESKRDTRRSSEKDPPCEENSQQMTKSNEGKKHVSRSNSHDRSKSSRSRSGPDRGRKGSDNVNGRRRRESQSKHRRSSRNDRHYSSNSENSNSDISSEQDSYGRRKRPSRKSSKFRDRSRSRSIDRSSKAHSTKRDNLDNKGGNDGSKMKLKEESPRKSEKEKGTNNENYKETKISGKRNRSSSFSSRSEQRSYRDRRDKKRSYDDERERSSSRRNR